MSTPEGRSGGTHEVRIELAAEALEFGREVVRAIGAAGGDDLVQRAEQDPSGRQRLIEPVLAGLGAWELAPRRDPVELEAAAALCRGAGYWAAPYPVAERLARSADPDYDGLLVVAGARPSGPVAGLELRWATVTPDGVRGAARALPAELPARESAFLTPLEIRPVDGDGHADLALALTLPCWTLLGMLDRALELARAHVAIREQFGRPLSQFQGVQFQLTDAEVERRGVDLLARYALWSIQTGRPEAIDDALALRLAALEAADIVFRVAHQVHGAVGFCDETTLSWLSRYSLALRRFPFGAVTTEELLTERIGRRGLTGLFSDPAGV
ncbi:acyl-CoA dehydrogenase family protein [Nocardia jinanensis]|uniref:Acyl-CoA dehydrogenase n=1 Tax=Nocardia jinanensis TaxID=382504 RepID=A0A917VVP2_9NOCA|nr:acyl-CoA dehydrogenase family protein [Nocardia jinanensis]GGL18944.1 acyl-CoA dehydrogenase [Nocardia jinanensis]